MEASSTSAIRACFSSSLWGGREGGRQRGKEGGRKAEREVGREGGGREGRENDGLGKEC